MSFTISDTIDRAKNRLGITNTAQDAKLLEFVDDAHAELNLALSTIGQGWKSTTVDINVVADTYTYTPASVYYCIQAVHFKVGDIYMPLEYDPEVLNLEYNTGTPIRGVSKWAFKGNQIYLYGVPNLTVTAGLRLVVFPEATDYASTDTVSEYVNAVRLYYVYYLCSAYREKDNPQMANAFSLKAEKLLQDFVSVAQRRYNAQNVIQSHMDF